MNFTPEALIKDVIVVCVVMLSASFHEFAHGWVAYKCGDMTAKNAGRLTLNPLAHLDLFGSIILPFTMMLLGGPVFGYAKPVPYNPYNLRNRRRDEVLVALAGPASNLLQVLIGAILLFALGHVVSHAEIAHALALSNTGLSGCALRWILEILTLYIWANLVLCFFNLLPLPPLDGSHVLAYFLKGNALQTYYKISHYALPILIVVLYILPMLFNIDPLGAYFNATAYALYKGIVGIALA